MREPAERLRDMLEAVARIDRYAGRGRAAFDADELVQTYVVHHLQILCEAAYKLPADFCAARPAVPWAKIRGMRHILVHDYFRVDLEVVWNVVQNELPALRRELEAVLASLPPAARMEGGGDGE